MQRRQNDKTMPTLDKGDQVWLEGKNLRVTGQRKLLPRRYGPSKIIERIRTVAYKLDLPSSMKIHNVFHINLLLPYKETEAYGRPFTHSPLIIDNNEEKYEIESIRDAK